MVSKIFTDIIKKAERGGLTGGDLKDSADWFRKEAAKVKDVKSSEFLKDMMPGRSRQSVTPGHMYCFYYDPKHKKTLPYFDRFPLIFPFTFEKDRFKGINLHYLPHRERAKLMDALYDLETKAWNNQRKLKLSYEILNGASKYKAFRPCIKTYLKAHVRSRFTKINHDEWNMAIMLPLEQFEKATKEKIWADSLKILKGL